MSFFLFPCRRLIHTLCPKSGKRWYGRGCRVIVPFGAKKFYTAIVVDVHGRQPQGYAVKTVWEILDSDPVLLPVQLDFWRWLADYYLCAVGDVYKAALPSGMKLESESKVVVNSEYAGNAVLSEREQRVVTWVSRRSESTVTQLQKECEDFRGVAGGKVFDGQGCPCHERGSQTQL